MNPLLLNISTLIKTERLVLRIPSEPEDSYHINRAIRFSLPELKPWLHFAQKPPTLEETEENRRQAFINFHKRNAFRFLILEQATNRFVGIISLENVDWRVPKAEIGYWLRTDFTKKGYITEAGRALCALGINELGLNRIEIRCEPDNSQSKAVAERLQFSFEAHLKQDDISADGQSLRDTYVYAYTKKDQHNESIKKVINQLETKLLTRNMNDLKHLLAEDFVEFGTSGEVYSKRDIINFFNHEQQELESMIEISHFQVKALSPGIVQATFQTREPLNRNRLANRSSLWRKSTGNWQMFFHQGTLVSQDDV
ncbi:Protein N-acetyltransferase, RimJ/RimL family [Amphibacillus marinus]|uniref:Protein N-acetyltransferase, RimJ/RimL family n=1 Tax=Amphibacillus marinus TaxID=872970 RepID=A0A1H8TYP9_9BACI|nr:GNAT family N-acetyltransferase [Amphibacillus marinus]SEO96119.1 Protein N-acetyltransferase, RimJ/RimL family [Amphibacillus marinus]